MAFAKLAHGILGKVVATDFDVVAERAPTMTVADDAERGFG